MIQSFGLWDWTRERCGRT